jgi:hypothetical protein
MANVKISQLPLATSPLDSAVEMPVVQGGVTKRAGMTTIGFLQSGTSAVLRTAQDKMRDAFSVADFGTGTAADFASAAASAAGRVTTVPFAGNTAAMPANYTNTVFEYDGTSVLRYDHTLASFGTAKKALRTQFAAAHSGSNLVAFNVEGVALGSGANGPSNADMGQNITIYKQGYGSGTAASGEIDGLTIFVRQDGPQGYPSGDPLSSDAAGILINTQNIGNVGFVAAIECATTNLNSSTFAVDYQIQTQVGVMNMNGVGAPKYGFAAVSVAGVNTSAYHADQISGSFTNLLSGNGSFTNIINVPGKLVIDAAGNYSAITTDWASGAWSISRPAGANSITTFLHRGTGALKLATQEAGAIQFFTSNTARWEVDAAGSLRPAANLGSEFGASTRRVVQMWGYQINLGTTASDGVIILSGAGTPEGAVTANVGSLFLRNDGGAGTTFYVKESGTGNTGWAAK